jgi:MYXO-CTERM domain-containing protein
LPPATPTSPRATATPTSTPLRIADDGCAIAPTPRSGSLWMWTLGLALVVLRRRRASHETSPRPSPWDRLSIFSEQPFDTPPILRYALRAQEAAAKEQPSVPSACPFYEAPCCQAPLFRVSLECGRD